MADSISLDVQFTYRTHKFRITSSMDLDGIRCKIGRYFHIKMDEVLLEIYDRHFELYIYLDDNYLAKMRRNVRMTKNKSFSGRIRFLDPSICTSPYDTIETKESVSEGGKISSRKLG